MNAITVRAVEAVSASMWKVGAVIGATVPSTAFDVITVAVMRARIYDPLMLK